MIIMMIGGQDSYMYMLTMKHQIIDALLLMMLYDAYDDDERTPNISAFLQIHSNFTLFLSLLSLLYKNTHDI